MLAEGQHEAAVRESRRAWQESPNSPDIFEEMIDIHCGAAMANDAPEGYADAMNWLRLAYGYDESNAKVRALLAERSYMHARQLAEGGRRREALQAVELCLVWDPEHKKGRELRQALGRH
jgi:hypothetical protein